MASLSAWMQDLSIGCGVVVSVARRFFGGQPVRVDVVGTLPFEPIDSKLRTRGSEQRDGLPSNVDWPYLFISGLDELERVCDARRRDRGESERSLPACGEFEEVSSAAQDDTFSEVSGVWFTRGRVRGVVSLDAMPRHGWFEMYAPPVSQQ